ncbi:hypothetical protein LTR95_013400 [Oleoguttula sp. CCFEE 5521]
MSLPSIESLLDSLHQQLTQIVARCNELNDPSGRWSEIEAYMIRQYEVQEVHVDFQNTLALIMRIRTAVRDRQGLVRPHAGDEAEEEEGDDEQDDTEHEELSSEGESDEQGDGETGDLREEHEMVQDSEQSITDAISTIDAGSNLGRQSEAGPESPVLTGLPDSSAQAKIEIPDSATATTTPGENDESSIDSNATLSVEDLITHLLDVAFELEPVVRRSWEVVVDESLAYEDLQSGLRRMARGLRATAAVLAGMIARMEASEDDGDDGDDEQE